MKKWAQEKAAQSLLVKPLKAKASSSSSRKQWQTSTSPVEGHQFPTYTKTKIIKTTKNIKILYLRKNSLQPHRDLPLIFKTKSLNPTTCANPKTVKALVWFYFHRASRSWLKHHWIPFKKSSKPSEKFNPNHLAQFSFSGKRRLGTPFKR